MSTWHKAVEDYVNMRRSLGFKLHEAMAALRSFASFLEHNGASHITIALALRWAQQDPAASPVEWAKRLSLVRGFARHWSAHDSETEIPPWSLLPHRAGRARPYIYTDDEVQRLLAAAQQLSPAGGLRGQTYHCLLGLLSVTGLRISEARNLQSKDVDLEEGILTIRGTKFGKSRLVPIHASTRKALSDYASVRDLVLAGPRATFSCPGLEPGWTAPESGTHFTLCPAKQDYGTLPRAADRASTIFAIGLRSRLSCSGTVRVRT